MSKPVLIERMIREGYTAPPDFELSQDAIRRVLSRAVLIVCDGAVRGFVQRWMVREPVAGVDGDEGEFVEQLDDIFNVAPSFDMYWMESDLLWGRGGMLFTSRRTPNGGWELTGRAAIAHPGQKIIFPFGFISVDVTSTGSIASDPDGSWMSWKAADGVQPSPDDPAGHDRPGFWIRNLASPLLAVQSLMHCANVSLAQHVGDTPTRRKGQRRLGESFGYRFHTLEIRQRAGSSPTPLLGTAESVDPLHVVRGHFKVFTAERPLFGRHVGTYWWPAHARGDESNGVIDKDYSVPQGFGGHP